MKMQEYIISLKVVEEAMKGDQEAFIALYQRYYLLIYAIGFSYFNNRETVANMTQYVFAKVYKQLPFLIVPEVFDSWLYTLAHQICEKYIKGEIIYKSININTILVKAERERIKAIMIEALDDMEIPLQEVSILQFYECLEVMEVVDILHISIEVMWQRISKMIRKLEESLKRNGVSNMYIGMFFTPLLIYEAHETLSIRYHLGREDIKFILDLLAQRYRNGGVITVEYKS